MATRALLGCVLLTLAFGAAAETTGDTRPGAIVVVHPATRVTSIARAELSKIFLKRLRTWQDGQTVHPVDQPPESVVRQQFSRRVHRRGVVNIEVYWKRMIFSGRAVPPRELKNDREVLEFVRGTPGGVGYVSRSAVLSGVRELVVEE